MTSSDSPLFTMTARLHSISSSPSESPSPNQRRSLSPDTLWDRVTITETWDDPLVDLRLTPMLLTYSSEVFGIALDTMARARNYQPGERSISADFDSEEFWTSAKLENWLSACDEALCHSVWHTAHHMGFLECVQVMHLVIDMLPRNLATYVYSLTRHQPGHNWALREVLKFRRVKVSGYLEALQRYSSNVQILIGLVKQSVEKNPSTNPATSADVYEHMSRDISAVVARLVVFSAIGNHTRSF
ncbi:hypothetical protein B0H14DRAFT_1628766 [Mycena olivaceomarginata]|nr:hypothetical protein B0H14DRAFT_1628766 [Mycena olivaceomarginata]